MTEETNMENVSKLHDDIEELKEKFQELGEDTTDEGKRTMRRLHKQLHAKADELMEAYAPMLQTYKDSGKEMVRTVETKVAEKPLPALLLAFGAGLVIGCICRCHHRHGS